MWIRKSRISWILWYNGETEAMGGEGGGASWGRVALITYIGRIGERGLPRKPKEELS